MLTHIWQRALGDLRADWMLAALALLFSTAPMVYADLYMDDADGFRLASIISIAMIPFQIAIVARSLARHGFIPQDRAPTTFFGRAFGQSFLSGLAIILGLLVLVIPGVILIVRWAVAMPVLIARDCGIIDSLKGSWNQTRGQSLFVVKAHAPVILLFLIALVSLALPVTLVGSMISETLFSIPFVLVWFVQPALFSALSSMEQNPA